MYADDAHHTDAYHPPRCLVEEAHRKLMSRTPVERVMDEMQGQTWTPAEASHLKAAIDKATTISADDAADRLSALGYTLFRNLRVVSPVGHTITDEERAYFDIIKAKFPLAKLI